MDEKASFISIDEKQLEAQKPVLQLVQPKHRFRPVALEKSIFAKVLHGGLKSIDSSAFNNRRSRIGFSSDGRLFSANSAGNVSKLIYNKN